MLATVGVLVQSFVQLPDPDRSAFSNTRPIGALVQVRCTAFGRPLYALYVLL